MVWGGGGGVGQWVVGLVVDDGTFLTKKKGGGEINLILNQV